MRAGRPASAARGGQRDHRRRGDTGWLVAPGDRSRCADALVRMLSDRAAADTMGARPGALPSGTSPERLRERSPRCPLTRRRHCDSKRCHRERRHGGPVRRPGWRTGRIGSSHEPIADPPPWLDAIGRAALRGACRPAQCGCAITLPARLSGLDSRVFLRGSCSRGCFPASIPSWHSMNILGVNACPAMSGGARLRRAAHRRRRGRALPRASSTAPACRATRCRPA